MEGTMPSGWGKESTNEDESLVTLDMGDAMRLESKKSCFVFYRNKHDTPRKMIVLLHSDMLNSMKYTGWVEPGEKCTRKITNPYLSSCAVFTRTEQDTWINRLRYWLKV